MKLSLSIICCVALLGLFFVGHNVYQLQCEKNVLEQRKQQLRVMVQNRRNILRDFERYKLEFERIKESSFALGELFRSSVSELKIIHTLVVAAERSGWLLLDIKPISQKRTQNLLVFSCGISAVGEYWQLYDFLKIILSPSFIPFMIVENIDLKPIEKKKNFGTVPKLRLQMLLLAYQDVSVPKPEKTFNDRALKFHTKNLSSRKNKFLRDPFVIETRDIIHTPLGLNFWSLEQLALLGVLQSGNKNFGLVQDPEGDIYKVFFKDKIGVEQKSVEDINNEGIFFSND